MRLRSFWAATALLLVLVPALAFAGTAYVVIWGAGFGYDNRVTVDGDQLVQPRFGFN